MNKTILKKYAKLIVRSGVNVQKGQKVIVFSEIGQALLAELIVAEAYRAGAKQVTVEWLDSELTKLDYRYASEKVLGSVLLWQEEKMKQRVKDLPCIIQIESEDPDALKGINIQKMGKIRQMRYGVMKPYIDEMDNKYQWVIAAAAGEKWAKKVFPGERTSKAVDKLWKEILKCVYIGDGDDHSAMASDPIAAWEKHNQDFRERCKWLNEKRLSRLEYKSSNGTDFTVGLIPTANWMGGGETSLQKIYYNPNMPTEEIFTSPMKGQAEGVLVSTKPLSYQGQLIDHFSIRFEGGKAVEVHAEQGEELLKQMLSMDETSAFLGEVALVPKESPINQTGILFYNTLFDENASCHVALGTGFPSVLEGFENMSLEDTKKAGVNQSMIHVDFMVGADDLSITGYTEDGTAYPIFRNGTWAF